MSERYEYQCKTCGHEWVGKPVKAWVCAVCATHWPGPLFVSLPDSESESEAEWQRTIRYAEAHESEWVERPTALSPQPPKIDLVQHMFDALVALNRLMAEQRKGPQ